jgi:DNA-binding CsgD family transcriptional regulator
MPDILGLSEAADLAYRVLLRRPGLTAAQLAAELGRPAGEAAEVLDSLAAAGLAAAVKQRAASRAADQPGQNRQGRHHPAGAHPAAEHQASGHQTAGPQAAGYQAVAPDLAFGRLLDQREQDLRKGRAQLHRLMEVFRESTAAGNPDGLVELVRGGEAIDTRVRQLTDSARTQIRAFDRPPYLQTPGANLDYESRRLREGISYRILYSRDALAWPGRYKADIAAGCEAGEQARVRGTLPTKLLLADSHLAMIPVAGADTPADLAYAIRAPALLAVLGALFESEWERGIPLGAAAVRDEPDETSRNLLQLLAAGLTDTAIARELDWSPRTTQRRVKELFDRLGVATRFQAGVVARDRGWL